MAVVGAGAGDDGDGSLHARASWREGLRESSIRVLGGVLGYELEDGAKEDVGVAFVDGLVEGAHGDVERGSGGSGAGNRAEDVAGAGLRVWLWKKRFAGREEGFFELVPGAELSEDDGGRAVVGFEEAAGEVGDANGGGEVGNQDGGLGMVRPGLECGENGLNAVVDGKEEAAGFWVGDRDGAALSDLVEEKREDAAL